MDPSFSWSAARADRAERARAHKVEMTKIRVGYILEFRVQVGVFSRLSISDPQQVCRALSLPLKHDRCPPVKPLNFGNAAKRPIRPPPARLPAPSIPRLQPAQVF